MPYLRTLTTISALASLPRSHRTHAVESRKKMDIEGAPTPPSTRLGGAAFAPGAWPPFHTSNQRPSQPGPLTVVLAQHSAQLYSLLWEKKWASKVHRDPPRVPRLD